MGKSGLPPTPTNARKIDINIWESTLLPKNTTRRLSTSTTCVFYAANHPRDRATGTIPAFMRIMTTSQVKFAIYCALDAIVLSVFLTMTPHF